MRTIVRFIAVAGVLLILGCSTTASFKLPPDTDLMIRGERVTFEGKDEAGYSKLKLSPFFWDAVIGVNFSLVQNDKVVREGRLPSQFRVISIFWPPYALIYWPMGFSFECYDLTKELIDKCPTGEKENKDKGTTAPAVTSDTGFPVH